MMWLFPIPGYIVSGLIIWLYFILSAELILFFKKKWITDILISVLWLLFAIVLLSSISIALNFNNIFCDAKEAFYNNDAYFCYTVFLWGGGAFGNVKCKEKVL